MTDNELKERAHRCAVCKIREDNLDCQAKAWDRCVEFLETVEKAETMNKRYTSKDLVAMVRNPTGEYGRFGIPPKKLPYVSVYEGTFILAAIACGFRWEQQDHTKLDCYFNIDQSSLVDTVRRLCGLPTQTNVAQQPTPTVGQPPTAQGTPVAPADPVPLANLVPRPLTV